MINGIGNRVGVSGRLGEGEHQGAVVSNFFFIFFFTFFAFENINTKERTINELSMMFPIEYFSRCVSYFIAAWTSRRS